MVVATVFGLVAATGALGAQQQWIGGAGATPDLERSGVTVNDAAGNPIVAINAVGQINFTLDTLPAVQFAGVCVDLSTAFNTSAPQDVDVNQTVPAAGTDEAAMAWLLAYAMPAPGSPDTPENRQRAAAVQIAAWLLTQPINATNPTDDAALNALAFALIAQARAATDTTPSLAMSIATPPAGTFTTVVNITGAPGATVQLSTAGPGTLGQPSVVLDNAGNGATTVTAPGPGEVTVLGATAGPSTLVNVTPATNVWHQATAAATPSTIGAQASVTFSATPPPPPPPPPPAPPTPPTPPADVEGRPTPPVVNQARALVAIRKAAPRRAFANRPLVYVVRVKNVSRTVARNVVVTDPLPRGIVFDRGARVQVRGRTMIWRLGNMRPGQLRTLKVLVRATNIAGRRTNVATVRASNAPIRRAAARTVFTRPVRVVLPAVTG